MENYKIKEGFKLRKIADKYIVVAVGKASKEFNGMINLNASGAFLWESLLKYHTKEELVKSLLNEYDITEEIASKDIDSFLNTLKNNGILE